MYQNDTAPNPRKLFVGNLPFRMTDAELEEMFAPFGEIVSVKIITDRQTGRSKGFAFVEYAAEDAAEKAIEALHGQDVDGRALVVNVARPPQPREDRGGRDNRSFRRE